MLLSEDDDFLPDEIRMLFQDLPSAQAVCLQVQVVVVADAHTPNAGATTTLIGVKYSALGDLRHGLTISTGADYIPASKAVYLEPGSG